jgi:hypothetical protein
MDVGLNRPAAGRGFDHAQAVPEVDYLAAAV